MAVYNVYCVYATVSKYHYLGRNITNKIFKNKITISSSSSVQELSNKVLTTFRQSYTAKKNTKKVIFDHFLGCLKPENLCITFSKKSSHIFLIFGARPFQQGVEHLQASSDGEEKYTNPKPKNEHSGLLMAI